MSTTAATPVSPRTHRSRCALRDTVGMCDSRSASRDAEAVGVAAALPIAGAEVDRRGGVGAHAVGPEAGEGVAAAQGAGHRGEHLAPADDRDADLAGRGARVRPHVDADPRTLATLDV